jgi:hypothetical protein
VGGVCCVICDWRTFESVDADLVDGFVHGHPQGLLLGAVDVVELAQKLKRRDQQRRGAPVDFLEEGNSL